LNSSYLDNLIEKTRNSIGEMAQFASSSMDLANKALGKKSPEGLSQIRKNSESIDDLHSMISHSLFKILARQSPVASDLRMVLSLGRINDCLKRIGRLTYSSSFDLEDYFSNPPLEIVNEVSRMGDLLVLMLEQGLQCFFDKDPLKAKDVLLVDEKVNQFRNDLLVSLKDAQKLSPNLVEGGFYLISVVSKLERIGDLISNMAEEVIFSATGSNSQVLVSENEMSKNLKQNSTIKGDSYGPNL